MAEGLDDALIRKRGDEVGDARVADKATQLRDRVGSGGRPTKDGASEHSPDVRVGERDGHPVSEARDGARRIRTHSGKGVQVLDRLGKALRMEPRDRVKIASPTVVAESRPRT